MSTTRLTVEELFHRLNTLNEIGVALSAERNQHRLLEKILLGAKQLTCADAGTLYTITPAKKLKFEIVHNDTLHFQWEGETDQKHPFPDIPLYSEEGKPNEKTIVAYAALRDTTVNIPDAYQAQGFDFSGTQQFDQRTGYHSQAFLAVPLKNHEKEIIGVLQLINPKDQKTGKIKPFSTEDQKLVESLASQAAVAMTNQALIQALKQMLESLIKVIADAIDEKSPVTGKHCKRVPIITMMIAEAVNHTSEGPYKDYSLSKEQLYELEIAALLHDCGKVVTPVHVIEKGKKLQTIHDRIDLIGTRFEVLKRDAELELLQMKVKALEAKIAHDFTAEEQKYHQQIKQLEEDLQFLRQSNEGREFMAEDQQKRVRAIAQYPWRTSEGRPAPFLTEDEVENLTISKGTLTAKEREIINYHVTATMHMLKGIPYPKDLRNVPEIAGGHHERVDGKGYPLGLTREQLSPQTRMLAIADIFEALTAPDRPYKKPMPLSLALKIMTSLKTEGHIDPELFDVFMKEKVYLRYGRDHLSKEQLDVT